MIRRLLALLLFALAGTALALDPFEFKDAEEEARFRALSHELRCVMCQNQSLADSNAQIAGDLRRQVLELIRQGKSDQEVKDFLVERYSEFVLYKPPVTPATWLLWFGPLLILLAGGVVVFFAIRRRARALPPVPPPDEKDQEW